uniref:Putative major royal jelly protein n=1 Tax=Lutzomyia longipalpis TaxID=7200 RepID=A0A7G3AP66_LUTLO
MKIIGKVFSIFLIVFLYGQGAQSVSPASKVQAVYNTKAFAFDGLSCSPNTIVGGHPYLITNNVLPTSISLHQPTGCLFIGIPRTATGIPATIAYVNTNNYPNNPNPPLRGFPSYQDNYVPGWFGIDHLPSEDFNIYPGAPARAWPTQVTPYGQFRNVYHFTSVLYTYTDIQCNRIFFIDSGTLEYPEGNVVVRRPVLWAFNVNGCNDAALNQAPALKVTVPDSVVNDPTALGLRFDIDVYGNCNEFAVYLTNHKDNRIVVYDNVQRSFWYFVHNTFNPLSDRSFVPNFPALPDPANMGVCGLTLGARTRGNFRNLYYAPASSYSLFGTTTEVLRNSALAPGNPSFPNFSYLGYRGPNTPGAVMVYDEQTQVVFFLHVLTNRLSCWNTRRPVSPNNIATLFSDLTYGVDFLITPDRTLYFMMRNTNANPITNRRQVTSYFYQTYRVNVDDFISGTIRKMVYSLGFILIIISYVPIANGIVSSAHVSTLYSWESFKFEDLPYTEDSQVDDEYDYYISENIVPSAFSYHDKTGCLFVAIARSHPGIPATITYVDTKEYQKEYSPPLRGFPTYEDNFLPGWFDVDDLDSYDYLHNIYPDYRPIERSKFRGSYHFISIYYTVMDNKCNRLFFLDYGEYRLFGEVVYNRRPVLWAFHINECSEEGFGYPPELKVSLPDDLAETPSGFSTFALDIYGNCNEFAVYMTNCYDNTIIVYDNVKKSFWYFQHETFFPNAEGFFIDNPTLPDNYGFGIMGIKLGRPNDYPFKDVYYSPGSSYGLFKTSTAILRDYILAPGDPTSMDFEFLGYGGLDSQSIMAYDAVTEVLFFIHLLSNTLQCWNTNVPLSENNVVTLFGDLEYGADIVIDGNRNLQFLLYDGRGLPYFQTNKSDNSIYQLYCVPVDGIIKDTACDLSNI